MKLAQEHPFDIFILVLNNIIFPSCNLPPEKRLTKALELLGYVKTTYRTPVIALYGYPDDPSFADKARTAGAKFLFRLPFDGGDLGQAMLFTTIKLLPSATIKFRIRRQKILLPQQ